MYNIDETLETNSLPRFLLKFTPQKSQQITINPYVVCADCFVCYYVPITPTPFSGAHSGHCVCDMMFISWFVYSQCATRGYSLLSTQSSLAAALLLRNLGALALAAAPNSHFLCFSPRMRPGSVDISALVSGPAGWGQAWLGSTLCTGRVPGSPLLLFIIPYPLNPATRYDASGQLDKKHCS